MYPFLFQIGPFEVFGRQLGPLVIASFGTMVALGFLAALYVLRRELARKGLDPELGSSIITAGMLGGIAGAKLYFVLFEMGPSATWGEALRGLFSGSGLTWYGGFAVAAAAIVWLVRRHGAPCLPVADAAGLALALGYGIGRIGCQLAGDGDYGAPTDLPWGMAYPDGVVPTFEKVHPTPVYETLMSLAIFGALWSTRKRLDLPGLSFCVYLVLSGLARFLVEFLRINPRVLWGLSEAQLISLAVVLVGSGAGFRLLKEKAV